MPLETKVYFLQNSIENMDDFKLIKEMFNDDQYAKNFGIVLDDLTLDSIKMSMVLQEKHLNFYKRPHGAAIYALGDAAFSVIGNNQNNISVALECAINYHKSPDVGETLYVEGKQLHLSKKIGNYFFEIYTLNNDKRNLVATMKSTLYRTGKPIQTE